MSHLSHLALYHNAILRQRFLPYSLKTEDVLSSSCNISQNKPSLWQRRKTKKLFHYCTSPLWLPLYFSLFISNLGGLECLQERFPIDFPSSLINLLLNKEVNQRNKTFYFNFFLNHEIQQHKLFIFLGFLLLGFFLKNKHLQAHMISCLLVSHIIL